MRGVELYGRVRYAVRIEGISRREAARPKLDPFVGMINRMILAEDKGRPAKLWLD